MNRFSRIGALVVAFAGAAVLFGWFFDVAFINGVLPGFTSMKVNTAFAFLAAGVALWCLHFSAPAARLLGRALSVTVAALGGLSLAEDVFGIDLRIDQLLLRDTSHAAGTFTPGRMAPSAALGFLFIGVALLEFQARQSRMARPLGAWTYLLALPPLFISTVAIVGYAYDVTSLYTVGPFISMAPETALSFFVLSLSLQAANPARGIVSILTSDTAGGFVARRLLPTLPFILFGIGWVRLAGQEAGLYDTHFGLALMVVLSITVCVLAVASTATRLHAVDVERKEAEAEIIALNAGLELRVQERTQELENTLAQVKQLSGLVPICAWCKKVRDDKDYWHSVEEYVAARTNASFSHGICPDCHEKVLAQQGL
jgi:hypothetical protein